MKVNRILIASYVHGEPWWDGGRQYGWEARNTMDWEAHGDDTTTAWMAAGNCRLYPPATFFPSDGVGVDKARKICAGCPVAVDCLEYALEHRIDHGVWGGCSERERRRILKRRRLAVPTD